MLRKFICWIFIIAGIILLLIVLRLLTNPRSRTGDEIRNELLIETPIGSYEEEVIEFIKRHDHWEFHRERLGTFGNGIDARFRYGDMNNDSQRRNIEVIMESHRTGIVSTRVSRAIWRLDEGRLVDIPVLVGNHQFYGLY